MENRKNLHDVSLALIFVGICHLFTFIATVIDGIIEEPDKFNDDSFFKVATRVKIAIEGFLYRQGNKSEEELLKMRY